jgi:hypothetical protein
MATIRDELRKIHKQHKVLTPALIVHVASDPDHPLHSSFEWDDTTAAHKYRLTQAQEMVRRFQIAYRDTRNREKTVREWTSVKRPNHPTPVYVPTEEVVTDELLLAIVLRDMEREWKALKAKYARYVEFRDLILGDLAA